MPGKFWSSRPDEVSGLTLASLGTAELELISSFLWSTRLGNGVSPHRDAAYSLMCKIEELMGEDFIEFAASSVCLEIDVMDHSGNLVNTLQQSEVEFVT
jgi:hypothetical protein